MVAISEQCTAAMKSRVDSTGNGNVAMHYGFQFQRRLKLSIDQVIRKVGHSFWLSLVVSSTLAIPLQTLSISTVMYSVYCGCLPHIKHGLA